MTLTHRLNQISQHLTNASLGQKVVDGYSRPLTPNEVKREVSLASQYFHEVLPTLIEKLEMEEA